MMGLQAGLGQALPCRFRPSPAAINPQLDSVHRCTSGRLASTSGREHAASPSSTASLPQRRRCRSPARAVACSCTIDSKEYSQQVEHSARFSLILDSRQLNRAGNSGDGGGRELMHAICNVTSVPCLESLLQRNEQQLNFLHISAALTRLAHLHSNSSNGHAQQHLHPTLNGAPGPEMLALAHSSPPLPALLALSHRKVQQMRPRELSNVMWAVAKLGVYPGKAWLDAFVHAAHQQMPGFNARDIGISIWAMARFRFHPGHDWMAAFLGRAQSQLGFLDAQALSNLLWGLATLDYHPSTTWLEQWMLAAVRKLHLMAPQAHANTVWALARMGRAPGPGWTAQLRHLLLSDPLAFSGKDLSMLLFALGSSCSPSQPACTSLGNHALAAAVAAACQQLHSLNCSDSACMLWGLAQLGHMPRPGALELVFAHTRPQLQHADTKTLAILAFALERLQTIQRRHYYHQHVQQQQQHSRASVPPISPLRHSSHPLVSSIAPSSALQEQDTLSAQHFQPNQHSHRTPTPSPSPKCVAPRPWLESFLAASYLQLPSADPHFCAMLGLSLACIGVRPSQEFLERYLQVCTRQCLPAARPVELMSIARAVCKWHAEPGPSWAAAFMARFAATLPQATPKQAANIVLALAKLQWPPPPHLLAQLRHQWEHQQAGDVRLPDVQQLLRAEPMLPGVDMGWLEAMLPNQMLGQPTDRSVQGEGEEVLSGILSHAKEGLDPREELVTV